MPQMLTPPPVATLLLIIIILIFMFIVDRGRGADDNGDGIHDRVGERFSAPRP
jgi:hypothetical protein